MRKFLLFTAGCLAALAPILVTAAPAGADAGDIERVVIDITYQGVEYHCPVYYQSLARLEQDPYGRTTTFVLAMTNLGLAINPECADVLIGVQANVFYRRGSDGNAYGWSGSGSDSASVSGSIDGVATSVGTQHALFYRCDDPPTGTTACTWSTYVQAK